MQGSNETTERALVAERFGKQRIIGTRFLIWPRGQLLQCRRPTHRTTIMSALSTTYYFPVKTLKSPSLGSDTGPELLPQLLEPSEPANITQI